MTEQNSDIPETQTTAQPSANPQAPAQTDPVNAEVTAVVSSLQSKLKAWLKSVYAQNKFLFFTVIPVMGLIYLIIKFHNILINLILGDAQQEVNREEQKDQNLANKANADAQQANNLANQANNLPSQEGPVGPNWDEK